VLNVGVKLVAEAGFEPTTFARIVEWRLPR